MLDWDDLRYFLALSRHGSLAVAAKELQVAQSTVSRRLASLEATLDVRLLHRTPQGYRMTPAGQSIREQVERLEAEALAIERHVGGHDARLTGLVRIACAEAVANYFLAPCCASLRRQHPDITIELLSDPGSLTPSERLADISVGLPRPAQRDLMVQHIGTIAFGLYASPDYLEENGDIDFRDGGAGHHLIMQRDDLQDTVQTSWLAKLAPCARLAIQTSSHEAALSAARHGGGLACLARFRAEREVGLRRVRAPTPIPESEIWVAIHRDDQNSARVRAVLTHITSAVRDRTSLLRSEPPQL